MLAAGSNKNMKKHSEATQTLHIGGIKVEPKIFTPVQTIFPGAWDVQNLISWIWSLPLTTDQVW